MKINLPWYSYIGTAIFLLGFLDLTERRLGYWSPFFALSLILQIFFYLKDRIEGRFE